MRQKILSACVLALLFFVANNVLASGSQIKVTDYNTFYDTQVNSVNCGGYWDERLVRVCDYRTELVDVSYKRCHYRLTASAPNSDAPEWETRVVLSTQSCPANWTIAGPSGQAPGGVYMHQHNSYFTQQEEQTVEYNCRMETRTVWVPVDGEHCPIQP